MRATLIVVLGSYRDARDWAIQHGLLTYEWGHVDPRYHSDYQKLSGLERFIAVWLSRRPIDSYAHDYVRAIRGEFADPETGELHGL